MKRVGLSVIGAIALFVAGWWSAQIYSYNGGQGLIERPEARERVDARSVATGEGIRADRPSESTRTRIPQEVLNALQGEAPARTPALLKALEKLSSTEFSPGWAAAIDRVLQGGDMEECQYVFSLMEQREESESVNYLIKQLDHPNEDVRHRAMMACEAVAGQVFNSTELAKAWSRSWSPDPDKQALFMDQQQDQGSSTGSRPGQRPQRTESLPQLPSTGQ